jgi:hypothetical protein
MEIFIVILFVIAGVAFVASRKPDEFRVTRSAVINASPAAVFEHVDDLEKWQAWSPWAKLDPNAKTSFEGPKAGVGAKFSWVGKKTGQGTMTILDSTPFSFVRFKLEFLKPMKATNTAEFTFASEGQSTRVTWTMYGPATLFSKVVDLFMNCGKMCSDQFDSGLANLKAIVEKK